MLENIRNREKKNKKSPKKKISFIRHSNFSFSPNSSFLYFFVVAVVCIVLSFVRFIFGNRIFINENLWYRQGYAVATYIHIRMVFLLIQVPSNYHRSIFVSEQFFWWVACTKSFHLVDIPIRWEKKKKRKKRGWLLLLFLLLAKSCVWGVSSGVVWLGLLMMFFPPFWGIQCVRGIVQCTCTFTLFP